MGAQTALRIVLEKVIPAVFLLKPKVKFFPNKIGIFKMLNTSFHFLLRTDEIN